MELRKQFAQLDDMRSLRDRARELANSIRLGDEIGEDLRVGDWAEKAEAATGLIRVLDQYPRLPENLLEIMTEDSTREALHVALKSAESLMTNGAETSLVVLRRLFPTDTSVSVGIVIDEATVNDIVSWARAQAADLSSLQEWIQFTQARRDAESFGLEVLVQEMANGIVPVKDAVAAFQKRFDRDWLDAAYAGEPALMRFRIEEHDAAIDRFRSLDVQTIERTHERIRARLLADSSWRLGDSDAPESSERGTLLREANKRRRHMPLRLLFKRMPTLLQKLKPCLMMSPLAVSTFLESERLTFDVVIFDEASQVRPHDAICAIYRGAQLLVAGDQKQLPPTNFFERADGAVDIEHGDGETDDGVDTEDFESILDVCVTLRIPQRRLRWHYRSRRESLIAFSNYHFYDGELVTFPSSRDVDGDSGIRFEYVPDGRWQGGGSGINPVEARRTAELVIEHAKRTPDQSLLVITMNQAQKLLVHEEIAKARSGVPGIEEFFSDSKHEPFLVQNLENVQGDERDSIILTINYAKNAQGTLSHNFGPLNKPGGERRLNVAVTRARSELIVVSSIRSDDIDLNRTKARGAQLLRYYLDFADLGPSALAAEIRDDSSRDYDSDFEREVAKALEAEGLDVRRQIGCGGFRIDLAIVDPQRPGRYVLGIECDGATYHSSATARDRDRLRQQILEDLGWTICRIWSTDWVRSPRRQVERVLKSYASARLRSPDPKPRATARASKPPINGTPLRSPSASHEAPHPPKSPHFNFAAISEVPTEVIDALIDNLLKENGATAENELAKVVAKRLGFDRTGARIAQRLKGRFAAMQRGGRIAVDDSGRLYRRD